MTSLHLTRRRPTKWHSHSWLCLAFVLPLLSALFSLPASAGAISGTVTNGSTGKVVPHQDVILISLQGGMQSVATVQTDAQGHFQFNRPEIGLGPMLVRVPYQGVNYHQAAPPGRESVDVSVFEAGAPPSAAQITSRTIIFQP